MRSIEAGSQTNFEAAQAATQPIEEVVTTFSEPAFLADVPQAVIAPTYPKLFRKPLIAAGGIAAAILTACGGGGDDASVALSTVEPVATVGQTVIVVEPTPTNTPDARTVIPTPTQETPVAQGPTEADKARVRDQADEILLLVSAQINDIQTPFYSRMSPDVFESRQKEINTMVEEINKNLDEGNITAARVVVTTLKNKIKALGDPTKQAVISQEARQKHDPENKHIPKNETIDPAVLSWYLSTVDILTATDSSDSVPTPAGTPPVVK